MIKTNELRIGNIVERQMKGQLYVVDGINAHEQDTNTHTTCIDENDFKGMGYYCDTEKHLSPIQLTEEWLLKFGFKFADELYSRQDFLFSIMIVNNIPTLYCEHYGGDVYEQQIKFVHQLQNLFFALTGNELEIKEPQPA